MTISSIPDSPRRIWAAKTARNCLVKLGIGQLPVDPFYIARQLKVPVLSLEEASNLTKFPRHQILDGTDSDIRYCNGRYKIIYNEKVYQRRIPFSIAHELGHLMLNHLQDFLKTCIFSDVLTNSEYAVLEDEADQFAAELLMPAPVLLELQVMDPNAIMKLCNVSKIAANHRSSFLNGSYIVYKHEIKSNIQVKELFRDYINLHRVRAQITQAAEEIAAYDLDDL